VVHDPVARETFAAARGCGATRNGEPIRVSGVDRVVDALLVTGFPYDVHAHPERSVPFFLEFLRRAQGIRRDGSAALNFAYLACGRFDGFWERGLSAWDVAAGALILSEAGGRVTDYVGGPFKLDGRELLATNGLIHDEMRDVLAAAGAGA
jgi:myo-inositol-1(or 4)-monophosphatase